MPISWNHPGEGPDAPDDKLPAWYLKARAKREAKYKKLSGELPKVEFTIPDRTPGWTELGMEFSCVPDATYPWDVDVVRAIRAIRSDLVPMWCRWVFLSPWDKDSGQEAVVFGRHALGMVDAGLKGQPHSFICDMPEMPCKGISFERPNKIWCVFTGEKDKRAADLPGAYVPFGWNIYQYVDGCPELSPKELRRLTIEKKKEEASRRSAAEAAEKAYIKRDMDRYADKVLSNMSEVELMEEMNRDESVRTPAPMVVVGKHA